MGKMSMIDVETNVCHEMRKSPTVWSKSLGMINDRAHPWCVAHVEPVGEVTDA